MKKSTNTSLALAIPMSAQTLDDVRAECKALVTRRAGLSAGATVVPIPGLDIGADMLLLSEMLQTINRRFGLSQAQIEALDPQLKKVILVAATSIGSEVVGRFITQQILLRMLQKIGIRVAGKSTLRFIPILGQAIAAGMSFGAMKMLGDAHVDDCYKVVSELHAMHSSV
jgi:hypothetical protein